MKAIVYFILFYASLFLISLIPNEELTEEEPTDNVEIIKNEEPNHNTSYIEFSDSIKRHTTNNEF